MQYVYVIISKDGFIFGVYHDKNNAYEVFEKTSKEYPAEYVRMSTEPLIKTAAHFPKG